MTLKPRVPAAQTVRGLGTASLQGAGRGAPTRWRSPNRDEKEQGNRTAGGARTNRAPRKGHARPGRATNLTANLAAAAAKTRAAHAHPRAHGTQADPALGTRTAAPLGPGARARDAQPAGLSKQTPRRHSPVCDVPSASHGWLKRLRTRGDPRALARPRSGSPVAVLPPDQRRDSPRGRRPNKDPSA